MLSVSDPKSQTSNSAYNTILSISEYITAPTMLDPVEKLYNLDNEDRIYDIMDAVSEKYISQVRDP